MNVSPTITTTANRCNFRSTPKQIEARNVIGSHKYTLLAGGSRSGKTVACVKSIIVRASKYKSRHVILRFHFNDAKQSIGMDTLPKVLKMLGEPYTLNKSDWVFILNNGSEIWIGGLDDKERVEKVLGKEYSTIYINEASQISYHAYTTAVTRLAENSGLNTKIIIDCNPPEKNHWLYKLFVLHKQPDTDMDVSNPDLYGMLTMNPYDNPHLSSDYISEVLESLPERQKKRFLYGEWLDKRQGALWSSELIEKYRTLIPPTYYAKAVVGIDPAVTSSENSDETGIVVVGMDGNNHFYVISDLSGKYTPIEWARKAVSEYNNKRLDAIIAETNQGGDMVENTVRSVDYNVNYHGVRATRGKYLRAEPVEALYEQGRVHHIGYFPELELEMTDWTPEDTQSSPDRLDALVWAITYLSQGGEVSLHQPNKPTVERNRRTSLSRPPTFGSGFGR